MLYNRILVRYGDLTLKGKNEKVFVQKVIGLAKEKLAGVPCNISYTHDRMYIDLVEDNVDEILKRLSRVSGLQSYSLVVRVDTEVSLEQAKKAAVELVKEQITKDTLFKVEAKRAGKEFPKQSPEISKEIAAHVLRNCEHLKVDVHNPETVLHIEVREKDTYVYLGSIKGMGGYPVGVAGKGLLMLSGGIDSPVAGYLTMKQGIQIECLHFESTPLTSIESSQKVIDLVKKMAVYAPNSRIRVHFVPFKEIHMALLENVPESYTITIMRRMMYRIAAEVCKRRDIYCVINGESVGQVASQTLGSMRTINSVTNLPIIRPLATYDKQDIIKISRDIDCFDISTKPFEDCCTVYVPKAPATNPKMDKCEAYEKSFDYEKLIQETVDNINTIGISADSDLDISLMGLEVREVMKELKQQQNK